jgi:hypothetical protein
MQIVKSNTIHQIQEDSTTTIWEYPTEDKDINGAVAKINGRNPEKGFFVNAFKELVFVLSGSGFIISPTDRKEIDVGDEIFLDKNEKYAWEAKSMTFFIATTPKFDQKKHIIKP